VGKRFFGITLYVWLHVLALLVLAAWFDSFEDERPLALITLGMACLMAFMLRKPTRARRGQ
jgi:hypothetical protein